MEKCCQQKHRALCFDANNRQRQQQQQQRRRRRRRRQVCDCGHHYNRSYSAAQPALGRWVLLSAVKRFVNNVKFCDSLARCTALRFLEQVLRVIFCRTSRVCDSAEAADRHRLAATAALRNLVLLSVRYTRRCLMCWGPLKILRFCILKIIIYMRHN